MDRNPNAETVDGFVWRKFYNLIGSILFIFWIARINQGVRNLYQTFSLIEIISNNDLTKPLSILGLKPTAGFDHNLLRSFLLNFKLIRLLIKICSKFFVAEG